MRVGSFATIDPAQSLMQREAEMRLITELLPVYVLRCDAQLRYRFVNPAYARRFGKEPEDLIGRAIPDVIGDAAYAVTKPYLDRLLAGEPVQYEATIPYPGLGPRFVRSTNVPEFDADRNVIGFVGALIDLSDRRQAEEALRESEERFRTLADNMSQLAWMADETGWVFWYNQRWYDFTGATLSEMQGWAGRKCIIPITLIGWWSAFSSHGIAARFGRIRFRCAEKMASTDGFSLVRCRCEIRADRLCAGSEPIRT